MKSRTTVYSREAGEDYYGPSSCGPSSVGSLAVSPESRRAVLSVLDLLEPDDYSEYLAGFLRHGIDAYGEYWRYADICTAIWAAAKLLRPSTYMEIGVRRGRSMAMVASAAPACALIGFDMWLPGYAGMENPGKELVMREVAKTGHTGSLAFVEGDSHETLKTFFQANPNALFDLVTVDGDHSAEGAAQDLADVLPHVSVGGAVVFDDIAHPKHLYLENVWQAAMDAHPEFRDWTFGEVGFGVAVAIRTL